MHPLLPAGGRADSVSFQRLNWRPQVKQRPRTTTKGGYRTYTPKETQAAEANLRIQWNQPPVDGPVSCAHHDG